jgi:hypothetical protein
VYSLHFLRKSLALPGAAMTAPAYCILRAEKLTSFGSIAGSAGHTFREIPTPNADPARTHLNKTIGAQSAAAVRAAIAARLPAKRRRDAVLCIEYLIAASPEWCKATPAATQRKYFNGAIAWLRERHGADNVVCLNLQLDETSPHLVAYVVPLTADGRLSAKDFLGGRQVLSRMQTEFAQQVGAPVGLQRGIEGSKAVHTTAKQFAAALQKNPTLAAPEPSAPTIADRITGRARQMEAEHAAELAQHVAQVEQARNVAEVSRHARIQQAAALERMRQELAVAKEEAAAAVWLRQENKRLAREVETQRTRYQRQVDELRTQLAKAMEWGKELLAKVGLLDRRRAAAELEADRLAAVLYPRTNAAPPAPWPR